MVAVTEAGAEVLRQAEAALERVQDVLLDAFTPAELHRFARLLERFERVFAPESVTT